MSFQKIDITTKAWLAIFARSFQCCRSHLKKKKGKKQESELLGGTYTLSDLPTASHQSLNRRSNALNQRKFCDQTELELKLK